MKKLLTVITLTLNYLNYCCTISFLLSYCILFTKINNNKFTPMKQVCSFIYLVMENLKFLLTVMKGQQKFCFTIYQNKFEVQNTFPNGTGVPNIYNGS